MWGPLCFCAACRAGLSKPARGHPAVRRGWAEGAQAGPLEGREGASVRKEFPGMGRVRRWPLCGGKSSLSRGLGGDASGRVRQVETWGGDALQERRPQEQGPEVGAGLASEVEAVKGTIPPASPGYVETPGHLQSFLSTISGSRELVV